MTGSQRISRRTALSLAAAGAALGGLAAVGACKPRESAADGDRCGFCGMKIDPASAWNTELVVGGKTLRFDTPKCALSAWRQRNLVVESSRFQEFYTRVPTDAAKLVFARGGDVIGPMGADLVPLDPASASRFLHDHGAKDTLKLPDITADLLRTI
jgi:hypothetical protein